VACGAIAMALHLAAGAATAQVADKKTLTLSGVKTVAAAAAVEARKNWAGGSIAVVDDGGNLLLVERLDNTFTAASNISIAKARSAANFRKETSAFENAVKSGRVALVANAELLPVQGDSRQVGGRGAPARGSALLCGRCRTLRSFKDDLRFISPRLLQLLKGS
jgi:glc operon protein GlcG